MEGKLSKERKIMLMLHGLMEKHDYDVLKQATKYTV